MPTTLNQGVTRKCNPSFFVQMAHEASTMRTDRRRRSIVAAIAMIVARRIAVAQQATRKCRIGCVPSRESVETVLQIFLRILRKQLEILTEAFPGATRVAVLGSPVDFIQ